MKLAFLIAGAVLAGGGAVWNVVEAILARRRVKASVDAGTRELVRQKNVTLESVRGARWTVIEVNLLPPSLVEARAERAKIPFLIAAGVLISLGLVLVIVSTCF